MLINVDDFVHNFNRPADQIILPSEKKNTRPITIFLKIAHMLHICILIDKRTLVLSVLVVHCASPPYFLKVGVQAWGNNGRRYTSLNLLLQNNKITKYLLQKYEWEQWEHKKKKRNKIILSIKNILKMMVQTFERLLLNEAPVYNLSYI